jgi:hypothetical protein
VRYSCSLAPCTAAKDVLASRRDRDARNYWAGAFVENTGVSTAEQEKGTDGYVLRADLVISQLEQLCTRLRSNLTM